MALLLLLLLLPEMGTRRSRGVRSWHQKGTLPRVVPVGKVTLLMVIKALGCQRVVISFFFLLSVPEGGNYEPFQLGTIRLQATALLWLGVRDARIRLGQPLSDIFESAKAIIRCRRQGIVDDSKRLIPPVVCSVLGIIIDKRDQFEI